MSTIIQLNTSAFNRNFEATKFIFSVGSQYQPWRIVKDRSPLDNYERKIVYMGL